MGIQSDDWFPAKKYGFGWGMPRTWQGWAVLAVTLVLLSGGLAVFPRQGASVWVVLYCLVAGAGFFAVCFVKGEPVRWRWGGK